MKTFLRYFLVNRGINWWRIISNPSRLNQIGKSWKYFHAIYWLRPLNDGTVILWNLPVNSILTAPTLFVSSFSSFDSFSRASTRSVTLVISMSRNVTSDLFSLFKIPAYETLNFWWLSAFSKLIPQSLSSLRLTPVPHFSPSKTFKGFSHAI